MHEQTAHKLMLISVWGLSAEWSWIEVNWIELIVFVLLLFLCTNLRTLNAEYLLIVPGIIGNLFACGTMYLHTHTQRQKTTHSSNRSSTCVHWNSLIRSCWTFFPIPLMNLIQRCHFSLSLQIWNKFRNGMRWLFIILMIDMIGLELCAFYCHMLNLHFK